MDWSNLFTIAGILFIGLTIVDFVYQAAAGLGSSGDASVPEAMYGTYCISGVFCIIIGLLLHKEKPIVLDEEE
tara:strand:+ start:426 stop:644 length:219 start_codon:yes stop_codon:yes gene_type:complete